MAQESKGCLRQEKKGEKMPIIILTKQFCNECQEETEHIYDNHDRLVCIKCRAAGRQTTIDMFSVLPLTAEIIPLAVLDIRD